MNINNILISRKNTNTELVNLWSITTIGGTEELTYSFNLKNDEGHIFNGDLTGIDQLSEYAIHLIDMVWNGDDRRYYKNLHVLSNFKNINIIRLSIDRIKTIRDLSFLFDMEFLEKVNLYDNIGTAKHTIYGLKEVQQFKNKLKYKINLKTFI